jgi:hypothetical protein
MPKYVRSIQEKQTIQMAYLLLPVALHYVYYLPSAHIHNEQATLIVTHPEEHTAPTFGVLRSTVLYKVWHTVAVPP